jgi:hypothetical protein
MIDPEMVLERFKMAQGWSSKALLALALAWMVFALNQVAIPGVYSSHNEGTIDPRAAVSTGLHPVYTLEKDEVFGWAAHPFSALILIALAALFILNINLGPTWTRYRYWIALAALIACLLPPDQSLILGVPGFILAFVAAILNKPAKAFME